MKKALHISLVIVLAVALGAESVQANKYKIGALMWHEPQHDNDALDGFKEGLEHTAIPFELDIKRAYGDEAKCREFARQWKEQNVDLILAVGTRGTLWTLEEVDNIPVVFTAVTNPVASGIADNWESSGKNVTGSSNWIRSEELFKVFTGAVPTMKTLGVIYSTDNPVPVAEVTEARKTCKSMGITLKEAYITGAHEIEDAIEGLIDQGIDSLWLPLEVKVYKNLQIVGSAIKGHKLPVVSSTLQAVSSDDAVAIVAATVDYKALGKLCVPAAVEIMTEGKNPADIPILTMSDYLVVINANVAESIGYEIPPIFLARANEIIRGFEGAKITVAGTGDSQLLLRELAQTLEKQIKGGKIEVPDSIGSGGGMKALIGGKIDIARVARPLKEKEQQPGLIYREFAKSPVVFVVHSSVTGVENLTAEQIIGIYSGKINNWNLVGGEKQKIYAVTREPGDSSLSVLNKTLDGFKDITEMNAKVIYSTPETVKTLIRHKKTIGFLPMAATVGTDLKILSVDGISPTAENVANGKYKYVSPFAIVYKEQEFKGLTECFVNFLYSDKAREIITQMGAVPTGNLDTTVAGN